MAKDKSLVKICANQQKVVFLAKAGLFTNCYSGRQNDMPEEGELR